MKTRHTLISGDGVCLTYYLWRQAQRPKPLLIMVHGLGSNHTRWSELIENSRLGDHWDIIAPDLRGHGESLTRGKITLEMWVEDLLAILNRENYPDAIFIGHSLGAHIVLQFFNFYPQRIRALILIDPLSRAGFTRKMKYLWHFRAIGYTFIALLRFANFLGVRRKHIPSRDLRDFDQQARRLIAQGKQEEMVKHYTSLWIDLKYNPVANYLQYTLQTLRPLPQIVASGIKTLILLSAGSEYNKGEIKHSLIEQIPHATVKEIFCNHWPLTEKPEEVRAIVETWLNQFEKPVSPS